MTTCRIRPLHRPISTAAALRRIWAAGLTLDVALWMDDNDLLRCRTIGRRTLYWIRDQRPI